MKPDLVEKERILKKAEDLLAQYENNIDEEDDFILVKNLEKDINLLEKNKISLEKFKLKYPDLEKF